ncbi:MAG TPA: protein kinase [Gammaproteobacteria bacterium]
MALSPGTRFGAYAIAGPLGAGGMGEVYRAKDTTLEREVALKLLPEAFAADANRVARFEQEAKTLAALNHPNIAQIFGLEKSGGATAIVMELVEGTTLAERIAQGPIAADEALGIAYQIADALEAAHEKQVIHRDLKPANVKLTPKGTVKVLDFGIAKVLETRGISGPQAPSLTTPAMTQAGILLGTAAYMSPEQARGKAVDRRADIWAFGCLLYEMLTGQPAFGGEDVPITLARVLAHGTDMDSLPGVISPSVRHTIALCLEKDAKKRIADIGDVRLALQGKFEAPLAQAAQPAAVAPLWRRALPLVATAVVVAVGAALVVDSRTPAREVRRSIYSIPQDQPLNAPGGAPVLAVSPDGQRIVYAAGGALYLRELSQLDGRPIAGTVGRNPLVPVFSPDGEWLIYASGDGQLERVSVNGGTPLLVVAESPQLGWRWDDDGMVRYVSACRISQVPATGGTPEVIVDDSSTQCVEPTLLPGTDYLLYEERPSSAPAQIVAHSLATGEKTVLFPGKQPLYVEPGYLVYFDAALGLMARSFDPDSLEYGSAVALVDDIMNTGQVVHFRISASGTLIYIRGATATVGQGYMIGIADETGNIEQLEVALGAYGFPSVSPDGTQLALQVGADDSAQIFVYDLSGKSEMRQLTFEGGRQPVWTPDGQWLTYASDRDGKVRIYRQRADGRGVAEALTDPAEGRLHSFPAWTPDGTQLAYTETGGGDGDDSWIVAVPGGTPELLVSGAGDQFGIAFAPNGEAFAYTSGGAGTADVFVEPLPRDGSRTRISDGTVPSLWPVWSRNGMRLSYQLAAGGFAAVDFDTRNFAIRNRRDLPYLAAPGWRNADGMPDDEHILLTAPPFQSGPGSVQRELVIVENWIEEVKQRVPRE